MGISGDMNDFNFIGREKELNILNTMYEKKTFQMMVIYGRRRVGKTTLLNKFSENKDPIFYTCIESKDSENRIELGNVIFSYFNGYESEIEFRSYNDILAFITSSVKRAANDKRYLIIIDEFPYLGENAPEFASVLQREIDREWSRLNIMIVLCGSSVTFMENEVLGEKSPLFGRRTGQIDLMPFDYAAAARFFPGYSPEDKAIAYGITGGIAKYLSVMDPVRTLDDNIRRNFFDVSGYFYEEPKNLLRQEFRDVSLYFAIISAVGSGSTQVSEIASKTGFDTPKVSQALRKLEAVRIIKKEQPILNEKNRKLNQYVLKDGMFRFWFRFVRKGTGAIERNLGNAYYENAVRPFIHDYMGAVFEEICQDYTFRCGIEGRFGCSITRVGKWRGTDPVKKCPSDVDVVGLDETGRIAVIGECKFRNEKFSKTEYETLLDRARLITGYSVRRYLMFSLSGFTDWVRAEAAKRDDIELIDINGLYIQT